MTQPLAPLFVLALALYAHGSAQACTPEEATAKAEQLAAKVAEITQRDPQRAAALREELKDLDPQTRSDELGNDCDAYDQRLRELEEAGGEVEEQMD